VPVTRAWFRARVTCEHVRVFGPSYDGDPEPSLSDADEAEIGFHLERRRPAGSSPPGRALGGRPSPAPPRRPGGIEAPPPGGSGRSGGRLERRRPGELTVAELAVRRRNRRWLVLLTIPAVILGVAALGAALLDSGSSPGVSPLSVPGGYKAVSDGVFAYAVPSSWSTSDEYSDDAGDLDTVGASGWAAEHADTRDTAPVAGETPPASFADFGQSRPTPYRLSSGQPTHLGSATVAYRYQITRPDGFRGTAIDAWQARSKSEVWLLIQASPATTAAILSTFTA
jgi:hypothetical protein